MKLICDINKFVLILIFLLIKTTLAFPVLKYEEPLISPENLIGNIKSGHFKGRLISIQYQRDDLSKVLKEFEKISGLKFDVDGSVVGKIRLFVNNLPWDQVLALVLDKADLTIGLRDESLLVKRKSILNFSDKVPWAKKFIGKSIPFAFDNMDIRNLIVEIYRKYSNDYGRLEVVIYPGLEGTVNCDLGTIPWDKGLYCVLKDLGLKMNITGNLMTIKKSQAYNKIHSISSDLLLKNLKTSKYSGQIIKLFVKEIDLQVFFKYLGNLANLNFNFRKNINDKISVECMRISWDKLLAMVLYTHYLDISSINGDIELKRTKRIPFKDDNEKIRNTIRIKIEKSENFSFKNSDLESVIKLFADKYLINLVFNPNCIKGKRVNYNSTKTFWGDALAEILVLQGLEFEFEEGEAIIGHFLKIREKL